MMFVLRCILAIAGFIAILVGLAIVSELYILVRNRLNRPKIGAEFLIKLLHRDDYVSIKGKVFRFSHIARKNESLNILAPPMYGNLTFGGELAFCDDGIGYVYYNPSVMMDGCDFIFGKYGLKWARNRTIANSAKDRINEFRG
jgi:hypothetical protein